MKRLVGILSIAGAAAFSMALTELNDKPPARAVEWRPAAVS